MVELEPLDELELDLSDEDELELVDSELLAEPLELLAGSRLSVR